MRIDANAPPVVKSRRPEPTTSGWIKSMYSSMRPLPIRDWTSSQLPMTCRSLPGPFLSSATASAASPFNKVELLQGSVSDEAHADPIVLGFGKVHVDLLGLRGARRCRRSQRLDKGPSAMRLPPNHTAGDTITCISRGVCVIVICSLVDDQRGSPRPQY